MSQDSLHTAGPGTIRGRRHRLLHPAETSVDSALTVAEAKTASRCACRN
ncbi:hypothetical protein ACFRCW_42545 [Streptomyces sp. NPDC056653]